jgi:glycosyltransferase involved in cell wall biosynthesis
VGGAVPIVIKSGLPNFDAYDANVGMDASVLPRVAPTKELHAKANEGLAFFDTPRSFRPRVLEKVRLSPENVFLAEAALPKVAILLCTYQGAKYLSAQLDSYFAQTHSNWEVLVSDDGSKDGTHEILEAYKSKWPARRLSVVSGAGEGFARNFLSVICNANTDAEYFAFSDQDDIWEADKLERAIKWLGTIPPSVPAIYCSRTKLIDAEGNFIGYSPLFSKPASFANALTQNIAGGNTMVLNRAAQHLLKEAGENISVVAHDWWAYMLINGAGGLVHYDPYPSVSYRQHNGNLIGVNASWKNRFNRFCKMWEGCHRRWNDTNIESLHLIQHQLTLENRKVLERFVQGRNAGLIPRLFHFKRSGIYRQTLLANIGLIIAAVINKI